ncbi:MAG TPA: hypothetical protein VGC45_02980 [Gryllotalpicola sp.]
MTERHRRALRGTVAAALAVFVAALFHVAGGGATPGTLGIVVSVALAVPASVLLAGRRTRLWSLTTSVVLSQLAFHLLFSLGQPSRVRFAGDIGMAGMPGMHLRVVGAGGTASVDLTQPVMWASHLVAALITIAAIHRGERVLRRMLGLAVLVLLRALRLARTRPLPRLRVLVDAALPAARRAWFLRGALRHRGPPLVLAPSY